MRGASALLGIVIVVGPAFAGEPISAREYEERCADYYARQYGVSPALVRAIIQVESAWQPGIVSPKGAMGLMQLMPATAQHFGVAHPFYVHENIRVGSPTWRNFRSCSMATFVWLSLPMLPARGRFSLGGSTIRQRRFMPTCNGSDNSIALN